MALLHAPSSCGKPARVRHGRSARAAASGRPDNPSSGGGGPDALTQLLHSLREGWEKTRALLRDLTEQVIAPFGTWYVRCVGVLALVMIALTLAANSVLPVVNSRALPHLECAVAHILDREVKVGAVHWVAPTGLVGVTPLLSVGPLYVGPSSLEGSSVKVPTAVLKVAPLASLLQRALVLRIQLDTPTVHLVQCSNLSWFGYPEDTVPSRRNFVPGLAPPPPTHPTKDLSRLSLSDPMMHTPEPGRDGLAPIYDGSDALAQSHSPLEPAEARSSQEPEEPSSWAQRVLGSVQRKLCPEVAVDQISLSSGTLYTHIVGETSPRLIQDVDAYIGLSKGYQNLELDIKARTCERAEENKKITLDNQNASLNLRPVTPGAEFPPTGQGATTWYSIGGERSPVHPAQQLLQELQEQLQGEQSTPAEPPSSLVPSSLRGGASAGVQSGGESSDPGAVLAMDSPRQGGAEDQDEPEVNSEPAQKLGRLRVRLVARHILAEDRWPDMAVSIQGEDLHAPMLERLLPVPIDINEGHVSGELRLRAHNKATWQFPSLRGRLHCKNLEFHFWDSPDSLSGASMDLLFEGDRMYLHNASGYFGGVPLTLTGDLDLNPLVGQYRLSASIPSVEINTLRATLGARPLPVPVTGAVRGVLHCTGPLEYPVFSGTAITIPPTKAQIAASEETDAKAALVATPGAVGAYDKVPFQSASAVFTFDTSSATITAEPCGGGTLVGSGRMWVAPEAEADPRAISMQAEGRGLHADRILQGYLPAGAELPAGVSIGSLSLKGTMEGAHVDSKIRVRWEAPMSSARGTADLSPSAMTFTAASPTFYAAATGHTRATDPALAKRAITQAAAKAVAAPKLIGTDVDVHLKGLDVMPLVSAAPSSSAAAAGQPVRLKLAGRTRFSGKLRPPGADGAASPAAFVGDLKLEGLRVNQLALVRRLAGELSLSESGVELHARGQRLDEALDVEVAAPLDLMSLVEPGRPAPEGGAGDPAAAAQPNGGQLTLRRGQLYFGGQLSEATGQMRLAVKELKLDELELGSLRGLVKNMSLDCNLAARHATGTVEVEGPRFSGLRGEQLSGLVRWDGDTVELEQAVLQQERSRYELQAEYKIPETSSIPSSPIHVASTLGAPGAEAEGEPAPWQGPGQWKVKVTVPGAELEEILPAARLLSAATGEQPVDYEKAKGRFLEGVSAFGQHTQQLNKMLDATARAAMIELGADTQRASAAPGGAAGKAREGQSRPGPAGLPGLQDLKGHWSGTVEAVGGSSPDDCRVAFNLHGERWSGGPYCIDDVVARGSFHPVEGLSLQQFYVKAADAVLLIQGKLLGPNQNAVVVLNDFPAVVLSPILRSVPALENAVPAATAFRGEGAGAAGGGGPAGGEPGPPGGKRPGRRLAGVSEQLRNWSKSSTGNQPADRYAEFADSPINGKMFVHGSITGSADAPEGEINVKLFDGAIGPTRLAEATAHLELGPAQLLDFHLHMRPADAPGHLRVLGKVPLTPPTAEGASAGSSPQGEVAGAAEGGAPMEVVAVLKDSGMMLLSALSPDFRWLSGSADIALRLSGTVEEPLAEGTANLSRASIFCRYLKSAVTNINATISMDHTRLAVEDLDAKVGKKGSLRVRGGLPFAWAPPHAADSATEGSEEDPAGGGAMPGIHVDASEIEVKVRNVYSGLFDGALRIGGSVLQPVPSSSPAMVEPLEAESESKDDIVSRAFTALAAGKRSAASRGAIAQRTAEAAPVASHEAAPAALTLERLAIQLGPDLRAVYPFVLNFGLAGEVELSGPASEAVRPSGTIRLQNGDINLVATQLSLSRDHPNTITFAPDAGPLDPTIDVLLAGDEVRALIQGGASSWQDNVVITSARPGGGPTGETLEQLDPTRIARIFEDQLAEAILAEDGQIAFSNLAASAVSSVMPKMETHGQLGKARWRLVSAPSIPGLLSMDPGTNSDLTGVLSGLTVGTEVEVQFGKSLQAAMARKMKESEMATELTLLYHINSNLRVQLSLLGPTQALLFQYSGEGVPK
eukprot:jgi/Tetstr1/449936/TSEL_036990.t1